MRDNSARCSASYSAVRARARRTSQHLHSGLTSLLLPENEQPTIPQGPHEPRFCFLPTPLPYKPCLRRDRAGNVCPTLPRLFGTPTICTFRPLSSHRIKHAANTAQHMCLHTRGKHRWRYTARSKASNAARQNYLACPQPLPLTYF